MLFFFRRYYKNHWTWMSKFEIYCFFCFYFENLRCIYSLNNQKPLFKYFLFFRKSTNSDFVLNFEDLMSTIIFFKKSASFYQLICKKTLPLWNCWAKGECPQTKQKENIAAIHLSSLCSSNSTEQSVEISKK